MIETMEDYRGVLQWTTEPRWVRAYWMFQAGPYILRGDHAHRFTTRLFVCLQGTVTVSVEVPPSSDVVCLSRGDYREVPPMAWTRLTDFSRDAIILCLADKPYSREEVVFDHAQWTDEMSSLQGAGPNDLMGKSGL